MSTATTYSVTGMTCGHCANAVTEELTALAGVQRVDVDLVPDGVSAVAVTSELPLAESDVIAALAEAGNYALA